MFYLRFWETLCQLSPWMLLGTIIAGLLHVFLPANFLQKSLRGVSGVFKAVGLGVPLPLCSCGVIPTGIGLKKNGASNGAAVGFLISTPQTGIDSVLVAASFLGWPFALFKVAAAAITGIAGGVLADAVDSNDTQPCTQSEQSKGKKGFREFWEHCLEILHSIWLWLIIGVIVSAVISVYIPQSTFKSVSAWGILPALILVLLISTPLYVCATASIPIAAALVAGGLPPSVALVFLMAGPATNIATITSMYGAFGWKTTAVYLLTIILGSFGFAIVFDWLVVETSSSTHIHSHDAPGWIAISSTILLLIMFGWFAVQDTSRLLRRRFGQRPEEFQEIAVDGMSCKGCVAKLEKTIRNVPGVDLVEINLDPGCARVSGEYDAALVLTAIRDSGFTPK